MALLAVLVPVVVLQSRRLEQRIDAVADALAGTRADLAEVRRDLHALAERVARIEGALTGPLAAHQRLACSGTQGRHSGDHRRVTCHFPAALLC